MCRYCFEGEEAGELIAPCKCSGGQRYVHLSCLRRWQRGVLVSQPTHPDYYDDDVRHRNCNVCRSDFTCRPPTRLDLMASFIGEDLAALVQEGGLIGSHRNFSEQLRRQVESFPIYLREHVIDRHWVDGLFLITKIASDTRCVTKMRIDDQEGVAALVNGLSEDWCWQLRGRMYKLLFKGPLRHVASADTAARRSALNGLQAPCTVELAPADADSGEDGVMAVKLTQPIYISNGACAPHRAKLHQFEALLRKAFPSGTPFLPRVTHFVGGPCNKNRPQFALVISGAESYQIFSRLTRALVVAQELSRKATEATAAPCPAAAQAPADMPGHEREGKRRRLEEEAASDSRTAVTSGDTGLPSTLDEALADVDVSNTCAGAESSSNSRADEADSAEVSDQGVMEVPGTAAPLESARPSRPEDVRVHVFWGTAGWSRCQLMGEIASGSWGLCRSEVGDVTRTLPQEVYAAVYPRLIFAPQTEMSESYDRDEGEERRMQLLQLRNLRRHRAQVQRQRMILELQSDQPQSISELATIQAESEEDDGPDEDDEEEPQEGEEEEDSDEGDGLSSDESEADQEEDEDEGEERGGERGDAPASPPWLDRLRRSGDAAP